MHLWEQIALLLGMVAIAWWAVVIIKRNPGSFSKENLGKSFYAMGILAVILIAMIAVCIWILRVS
jgi:hypothetical protein